MQKTSDNANIGNSLQMSVFACVLLNLIDLQKISYRHCKSTACLQCEILNVLAVTTVLKRPFHKIHIYDLDCGSVCAWIGQACSHTSCYRYGTSWHCWSLNFDESVCAAKGCYLLRNAFRSQCKYISACRNLLICFSFDRPQWGAWN